MSLIDQKELSDKLGVSRNTIYIWRKQGCPFIKRGRILRFELQKVIDWLSENKEEGASG